MISKMALILSIASLIILSTLVFLSDQNFQQLASSVSVENQPATEVQPEAPRLQIDSPELVI